MNVKVMSFTIDLMKCYELSVKDESRDCGNVFRIKSTVGGCAMKNFNDFVSTMTVMEQFQKLVINTEIFNKKAH